MTPTYRRSRHSRWLAVLAELHRYPGCGLLQRWRRRRGGNQGQFRRSGGQRPRKISKEQATQAALQALPGKVTDVTIEKKRGKTVYVIEIVAEKDGAETDVLVDMTSGAVLGMDH